MHANAADRPRYSFHLAQSASRRGAHAAHAQGLADPGDLLGAANLAWAESAQRWQPHRASLSTYAWWRMNGRVRDCLRSERRHRRLQRQLIDHGQQAWITPAWTEPLALRQAIAATEPAMSEAEQLILRRVYQQGSTLQAVAVECATSADRIERAHQRLLERLREAVAAVSPQPTKASPRPAGDGPSPDLAAAPDPALAGEPQGEAEPAPEGLSDADLHWMPW